MSNNTIPVPVRGIRDVTKQYTERFNQHKLKYIIDHKDEFKIKESTIKDSRARLDYLKSCFGPDYDPYMMASKYLKHSNNGIHNTVYKQNGGVGRFHAVAGLSQQGMPLEIRHTIANEFYNDVDMKNAHPVILAHLCEDREIDTPYLNMYIHNRDEFLKTVDDDRDTAKQIILSVMNGGTKDYNALANKSKWIKSFKREMHRVHMEFAEDAEFAAHKALRVKAKKERLHEASYVNILLCHFENRLLEVIHRAVGSPADTVLCFDGLQVLKNVELDLPAIERKIKSELDIDITLTVKAMDKAFDLPSELDQHVSLSIVIILSNPDPRLMV